MLLYLRIVPYGGIGLKSLRNDWSPALTISELCVEIIDLLHRPDTDDGILRLDIARQIQRDRAEFVRIASECNCECAAGSAVEMDDVESDYAAFQPVSVRVMDERHAMIQQSLCALFGDALGDSLANVVRSYYGRRKDELRKCSDVEEVLYGAQQGPPTMQVCVKTLAAKTLAIGQCEMS